MVNPEIKWYDEDVDGHLLVGILPGCPASSLSAESPLTGGEWSLSILLVLDTCVHRLALPYWKLMQMDVGS
jgi:hypothetical protein